MLTNYAWYLTNLLATSTVVTGGRRGDGGGGGGRSGEGYFGQCLGEGGGVLHKPLDPDPTVLPTTSQCNYYNR